MTEVALQNPRRYRDLRADRLHDWLVHLVEEVAPGYATLGIRFVDDREMQALNKTFRAQDRPTDVLSFAGEASAEGRHLGDIVICVPAARRQALEAGVSEHHELRCLLLHGVLHCLGYDHEADQGQMQALETRLRQRWVCDVD